MSMVMPRPSANAASMRRLHGGLVGACIWCLSGGVLAGPHTVAECFEGSDFIANAAMARDNGISRTAFLARLEEDFVMIRAYPPALRWFAKDVEDERLLHDAAVEVFDAPRRPAVHRARFLEACFAKTTL